VRVAAFSLLAVACFMTAVDMLSVSVAMTLSGTPAGIPRLAGTGTPAAQVARGGREAGRPAPADQASAWVQALAGAAGRYTGPSSVKVSVLPHSASAVLGVPGVVLSLSGESTAAGLTPPAGTVGEQP
jgi:hypothetical protein